MAQLQDLFQTHAIVKILDHLTLYKDFEYTKTDITNETGISRRTLYQNWPILEKFDLVKVTKSSGKIKFYKLNTENPISKQLVSLVDEISFFATGLKPEKVVRGSGKIIVQYERMTMEAPSQVGEKMIEKVLDLTNGETTLSVTGSSLPEFISKRERKQ